MPLAVNDNVAIDGKEMAVIADDKRVAMAGGSTRRRTWGGVQVDHRPLVLPLIVAIFVIPMLLTGCGDSAPAPTDANGRAGSAQVDDALADHASKSEDGPPRKDDLRKAEEPRRLTMGPLSFTQPAGWEPRETPQEITLFAPDRPAWKQAGFRPNLGVRRRAHPGVSLDRHRDNLDQLLSQSVQQVNRTISEFAKQSGEGDGKSVELKETGKYTLVVRDLDGARVISSTFSGVFQLRTSLTATKTYGIQYIDPDALYTISLTFPRTAETEMEAVWKAFERDLRVER